MSRIDVLLNTRMRMNPLPRAHTDISSQYFMDPCPLQTPEEAVELEKREGVGWLRRRFDGLVPNFEVVGGARGEAEEEREGGEGTSGVPPSWAKGEFISNLY